MPFLSGASGGQHCGPPCDCCGSFHDRCSDKAQCPHWLAAVLREYRTYTRISSNPDSLVAQWFQAALWAATTIALFVGYQPPKRHTNLDHLSFWRKISCIDLIGCGLLTAGLTLFITGTSLGGGLYTWTNVRTVSTMVIGIVTLIAFGIYEWKGTKTGILNHDLFRGGRNKGRTFAICLALVFVEAILAYGFGVFYPIM